MGNSMFMLHEIKAQEETKSVSKSNPQVTEVKVVKERGGFSVLDSTHEPLYHWRSMKNTLLDAQFHPLYFTESSSMVGVGVDRFRHDLINSVGGETVGTYESIPFTRSLLFIKNDYPKSSQVKVAIETNGNRGSIYLGDILIGRFSGRPSFATEFVVKLVTQIDLALIMVHVFMAIRHMEHLEHRVFHLIPPCSLQSIKL